MSSRELAGQELPGYTKRKIVYEHLSPENVAQLDKDIDCWIMALPNGVCKPYIEALNQVQNGSSRRSVIVDLSADYRFDSSFCYGSPVNSPSALRFASLPGSPTLAVMPLLLSLALLLCLTISEASLLSLACQDTLALVLKPSPKNDINLLKDNLMPYSPAGHIRRT